MSVSFKRLVWFVEKDGKVLGPVSHTVIETCLRAREISPITKIADSSGKWRMIRDEPQFAPLVKAIKEGTDSDISYTSSVAHSFSEKSKITKGLLEQLSYSRNKVVVTPVKKEEKEKNGAVIKFVQRTTPIPERVERRRPWWQRNVKEAVFIVAISVLVLSALGFYFYQKINLEKTKSQMFAQILEDAREAEKVGDIERAHRQLERLHEAHAGDLPLKVEEAKILVEENQLKEAAQLLEAVLAKQGQAPKRSENAAACDGECVAEAANLLGVIALRESDSAAAEKYLRAALQASSQFGPALFNLAVVNVLRGDSVSAEPLVWSGLKNGGQNSGAVMVTAAEIAINSFSKNPELAAKLEPFIDQFTKKSTEFVQQISIARALLELLEQNKPQAEKFVQKALNQDPLMDLEQVHDTRYFRGRAEWQNILNWCQRISVSMTPSAHATALLALCYYNGGDKMQALDLSAKARKMAPADGLTLGLYSYMQKEWDRYKEANDTLALALRDRQALLPLIVSARRCDHVDDPACAKRYLELILFQDPNNVFAHTGMARYYFKTRDYARARGEVQKALTPNSSYKPLLKLNEDLSDKTPAL